MTTATTPNRKLLTILLVEDDDGDARAVQRAFSKTTITNPILRAVDGIEALEILKGTNGRGKPESPCMLMVDINMPRMNGMQLVKAMRDDKELRPYVVFMLTTSKREEDKLAAYNLNVAGYIVKEKAGDDFLRLVDLMDSYWRIIELP